MSKIHCRPTREHFYPATGPDCEDVLASTMLRMLLKQDGSTSRLLEGLSGNEINVCLLEQAFVDALPRQLAGELPGNRFLRRLTALEARGHVLLDSISYTAIDALPASVGDGLLEGTRPIGHVLSGLWTKRTFRRDDAQLLQELWTTVGQPDPQASRTCLIQTPAGPCMLLAETFRRGILALATF